MLRHWLSLFDGRDTKQRLKRSGAKIAVDLVLDSNVALGTCFSEDRDLLSQWRGYAQDGAGFSVSFDRRELEQLTQRGDSAEELRFSKILYGDQDWLQVNAFIKSLHDAFGSDAEKYQESQGGIGSVTFQFTHEKHEKQRSTARELFTVKNGAFREEKEWRLFIYDSLSKIANVEFRESRGVLSPFVRMKVPVGAIVGVTIGPTNKTSESMVKAALEAYQVDAWVKRSNASYRNS
jgi:Protein of unknown function (DUF2971)